MLAGGDCVSHFQTTRNGWDVRSDWKLGKSASLYSPLAFVSVELHYTRASRDPQEVCPEVPLRCNGLPRRLVDRDSPGRAAASKRGIAEKGRSARHNRGGRGRDETRTCAADLGGRVGALGREGGQPCRGGGVGARGYVARAEAGGSLRGALQGPEAVVRGTCRGQRCQGEESEQETHGW